MNSIINGVVTVHRAVRTEWMFVHVPGNKKKTWLRVGNFKGVIVKTTDDGEMAKAQLRALYEVFSFLFF